MMIVRALFPALSVGFCLALFAGAPAHAAGGKSASAAEAVAGRTLVLGRISNNPRKHLPKMDKLAGYLAVKLKDLGVGGVRSVTVPDRGAMASALGRGEVDLYSETILSSLYLEAHGGEIILREWKKGVAHYCSVIVVRTDRAITNLGDLQGRKIAFEDLLVDGRSRGILGAALDVLELELE